MIGCFYILPKRFFECAPAVWKFGIFFLFAYIFRLRKLKREIALPPSKITKIHRLKRKRASYNVRQPLDGQVRLICAYFAF